MTAWQWFQSEGDKLFNFVSLASIALVGVPGVPHAILQGALIAGVLATAAHNSFFPTAPKEQPK